MTPMMLDSCLYSSLVAHFLSPFFFELDAFSGEAIPVMSVWLLGKTKEKMKDFGTNANSMTTAYSCSLFVVA